MLTPKQRQHLKGLAHPLKPIVMIGKKGYSKALLEEMNAALLAHELIKVKFLETAFDETNEILNRLCQELDVTQLEIRGHIATLYRAHPEKPRIQI